jgi:hypothetical protein
VKSMAARLSPIQSGFRSARFSRDMARYELVVWPEMLEAGMEALIECRGRELKDEDICLAVYLAMEGIREIRAMRTAGTVH